MSTKIQQYRAAYKALEFAQKELHAATKLAYPIGLAVVSHLREYPIYGHISGYGNAWTDPGCVYVQNEKTGKEHRAYPMMERNGRAGVTRR